VKSRQYVKGAHLSVTVPARRRGTSLVTIDGGKVYPSLKGVPPLFRTLDAALGSIDATRRNPVNPSRQPRVASPLKFNRNEYRRTELDVYSILVASSSSLRFRQRFNIETSRIEKNDSIRNDNDGINSIHRSHRSCFYTENLPQYRQFPPTFRDVLARLTVERTFKRCRYSAQTRARHVRP